MIGWTIVVKHGARVLAWWNAKALELRHIAALAAEVRTQCTQRCGYPRHYESSLDAASSWIRMRASGGKAILRDGGYARIAGRSTGEADEPHLLHWHWIRR